MTAKESTPEERPRGHAEVPAGELTEDDALALLGRRDLTGDVILRIVDDPALMKSRRVLMAIVAHPQTPRHISLPRTRHLYTFELMHMTLSPAVAADVKLAGEEVIFTRLGATTAGERLALAKRASTRIAAALLLDPEERVMAAALENSHLTETYVVRAVQNPRASAALVHSICKHSRWSLRHDIRVALLRNRHTPLARALFFAQTLPPGLILDVLDYVPLPLKAQLEAELERRGQTG